MHPDRNSGRQARATAITKQYGSRKGVYYVDAAGPTPEGICTVAVLHEGLQVDVLSVKTSKIEFAEETAIALAATHSDATHIMSDSQQACRNFIRGRIALLARKILTNANPEISDTIKQLVWVPGHQGVEGNEAAHTAARASLPRSSSDFPGSDRTLVPYPLTTFSEVTTYLRHGRRAFPVPAKGLDRTEERHLRRLQTGSFYSPAMLKHINPSFSGSCNFCGQWADTYHMVWACQYNPGLKVKVKPTREGWEAALSGCSDLESQRALVQRARAAASTNGIPD